MARKVINRMQLREEMEAAEEAGMLDENEEGIEEEEGESEDEDKPKKKAAKATKRKSKSKDAADVRLKLYWGVFNQSTKQIALYEFSQKKYAEAKAAELSQSGKNPHYVQKVKLPVKEA